VELCRRPARTRYSAVAVGKGRLDDLSLLDGQFLSERQGSLYGDRCTSPGDLRAEVKRVVWHEVAHWLGHNEEEVRELGLSPSAEGVANHPIGGKASKSVLLQQLRDTPDEAETANEQQLRCLKCYSADVTCRELNKPLTNVASSLSDLIAVHAKICTCNSCGYEWDDEDNI